MANKSSIDKDSLARVKFYDACGSYEASRLEYNPSLRFEEYKRDLVKRNSDIPRHEIHTLVFVAQRAVLFESIKESL